MGDVAVGAELKNGFQVKNSARSHEWFADEPIDVGGEDLAPEPSELLLSALASCKLITMRMYAERKGRSTDGLSIHLGIIQRSPKTRISKKISFPKELDEAQCERLMEISGRCPVAKMVQDSIEYVFD